MSRHNFDITDPQNPKPLEFPVTQDGLKVLVVGWDRPLGTYFFQVISIDPYVDDHIIVWEGFYQDEISNVVQLADQVKRWAILSTDIQTTLIHDRAREGEKYGRDAAYSPR